MCLRPSCQYYNTTVEDSVVHQFQRSQSLVNKKASNVFNGSRRKMLAGMPEITEHLGSSCEKSRRNVYDALAFDFDSPEENELPEQSR